MLSQICYFIVLFTLLAVTSCEEGWTGKWFPETTTEKIIEVQDDKNVTSSDDWNGKWFPREPSNNMTSSVNPENDRIMGIPNSDCDDGELNLSADFDPKSFEHSLTYTCLEPTYKPNYDVEPIETVYDVPKRYTPVHKCMNETIFYDQRIPTLGYHRPLWAAFGEYTYLPPQRWLHNLEHGAIVCLYHPCAHKGLVESLKAIVRDCLYRHIITPYRELSIERPFALAGWGTSLEFSVIDKVTLTEFIKNNAKMGPEKVSRNGQYKKMLTEPAKIITDVDDFKICPNGRNDVM